MNLIKCGICLQADVDCLHVNINDSDKNGIKWLTKMQSLVPELENILYLPLCRKCVNKLEDAISIKQLLWKLVSRQHEFNYSKEKPIDELGIGFTRNKKQSCNIPEFGHISSEIDDKLSTQDCHDDVLTNMGDPNAVCTNENRSESEESHCSKKLSPFQLNDENVEPININEANLDDHVNENDRFICDCCDELFSSESQLISHRQCLRDQSDNGKRSFICTNCNNFYVSERNLNLHKIYCGQNNLKTSLKSTWDSKKRKGRKTGRSFSCEICGEQFSYIKLIKEHCVTQHSMDEKSIKPYSCNKCDQRFSTSTNLQKHIKYHDKTRNKVCSFCGKSFITNSDLSVHEYTHYNRRNYKCIKCDKAFNTNKHFWTHNLVVHTDPSQWKHECSMCSKRFPLKSSFDEHMKRHVGKKDFSCHICAKLFVSYSEMKRHLELHSNIKSFKCKHCEKEYKYQRSLKVHISTAHGLGNVKKVSVREKNYVCHICPSQFYDKQKLTRHLYSHSGLKPFSCTICDKKFADKSYINQHMKLSHKTINECS